MLTVLLTVSTLGLAQGQGLTLWTSFQGPERAWLEREVAAFRAVSDIDVELVDLAATDLTESLITTAQDGAGPDVAVPVGHDQLPRLAGLGVLAALSASNYGGELTEPSRLAFSLDGQLFGLPLYVEGPALVSNRDLVPEVPGTFEAFVATARELTTPAMAGFLQVQETDTFFYNYIWINSLGGYVFGRDDAGNLNPSDLGLANEGAVQGAEVMRDLRYSAGLVPPGIDYAAMHDRFLEGSVAMIYNGPWAVPEYQAAGLNIEVTPIPPREDGTAFSGFMSAQGAVVNAFSDSQADATLLAAWLGRDTAQVSLARAANRIPASLDAVAELGDMPIIAGFAAALANAEPIPAIPEMGAVWDPMRNALELILESPTSDIAAILNGAVEEIRGTLAPPQ